MAALDQEEPSFGSGIMWCMPFLEKLESHGGHRSFQGKLFDRVWEDEQMSEFEAARGTCSFDGKEYSHEAEVCTTTKCMRCDDGNWLPSLTTSRERDFVDWL